MIRVPAGADCASSLNLFLVPRERVEKKFWNSPERLFDGSPLVEITYVKLPRNSRFGTPEKPLTDDGMWVCLGGNGMKW